MFNLFRRITYPQKFALISLLFILPLVAFLPMVQQLNTNLDRYGNKELQGVLYLRPLQHIMQDVQTHELVVEEFLDGEAPEAELLEMQAKVDQDFVELQDLHQRYNPSLQLGFDPSNLRTQWQAIKTGVKTT